VHLRDGATATLRLPVPGRHNLQNALGAIAVGLELGVPLDAAVEALAAFTGAERRFQILGTANGITVVDDYGHHPTEIAAVLDAARDGQPARVVAVFQPHRYSRTRDLHEEFGPALARADVVVLTDIYAAGEEPIAGVTLDTLSTSVRRAIPDCHVVPDLDDVPAAVARLARSGDLVVLLGAGSIGRIGHDVLGALAAPEASR